MIKGFDGIRALAVIVVFFNHWTAFGRDYHTGDYGVWTFFALSGFLIIRALHRDRIRVEKGVSAKSAILEFYGRRALRIFPVYYATLLAVTLVSLVHSLPNWDFPSALAHYTYTTNIYIGVIKGAFIGWFSHFWSLAVEQQFYLFAAPLFLLSASRLSVVICGVVSLFGLLVWAMMHLTGTPAIAIYTNSFIGFGMITMGGLAALLLSPAPQQGNRSWLAVATLTAMALIPLVVIAADSRGVVLGLIKLLACCAFGGDPACRDFHQPALAAGENPRMDAAALSRCHQLWVLYFPQHHPTHHPARCQRKDRDRHPRPVRRAVRFRSCRGAGAFLVDISRAAAPASKEKHPSRRWFSRTAVAADESKRASRVQRSSALVCTAQKCFTRTRWLRNLMPGLGSLLVKGSPSPCQWQCPSQSSAAAL